METVWADLRQRLEEDLKLAEVLQSLEEVAGSATEENCRQRLKVPYANATALDEGTPWN
jgi:hypothetical protein